MAGSNLTPQEGKKHGRGGYSSLLPYALSPPSCVCRSRASGGGRLTQASRLGNASKIGPFFLKYAVPISQKTCRATINYVGALERGEKIPSLETFIVLLNALEVSSDMVLSSLLVEKHQADASRLMDRMQNLPAYDIERILAVVDVLIQYSSMDQE